MSASLEHLRGKAIRPTTDGVGSWRRSACRKMNPVNPLIDRECPLTAGEVHGHFKANAQIGERRFFPHGSFLVLYRRLCRMGSAQVLAHGGAHRRILLWDQLVQVMVATRHTTIGGT